MIGKSDPLSVSGFVLDTSPPEGGEEKPAASLSPFLAPTQWGRGVEPEGRGGEGVFITRQPR